MEEIDAASEHGDHDGEGQDAELGKLDGHGLHVADGEKLAGQKDTEGDKNHHRND
ncbi:MAG: hypothetical protein R2838_09900 [Caldilineaceae bacterium]